MAVNSETLDALIAQIYDAALEDELWPSVIHQLAHFVQASDSLMFSLPGAGNHQVTVLSPFTNADADAWNNYASYYWQHDIWMHETKSHGLMQSGAVINSDQLVERRIFRKSEIYRDLLKPKVGGVEVNMGVVVFDDSVSKRSQPFFISLYKKSFEGVFTPQNEKVIHYLLPHLQRALRMRWKLVNEQQMRELREQALEQVSVAVVLLDEMGRLLFANQKAETVLRQEGNPTVMNGILSGIDTYENSMIKHALRQALKGIGRTLRLDNPAPIGTRIATFSPITTRKTEQLYLPTRILVMITEPEKPASGHLGGFAQLYRLTPAETRVLEQLLVKESTQEIAETLQIGIKTLRTQLSALFAKTQTKNQRELVKFYFSHPMAGPMLSIALSAIFRDSISLNLIAQFVIG
jgi:DNA-binding CsgD family transcriptional regulator